jgi:hypothetical protein
LDGRSDGEDGWAKAVHLSPKLVEWRLVLEKYGSAANQSVLPGYLKNIPLSSAAVAWQKLSPTKALW